MNKNFDFTVLILRFIFGAIVGALLIFVVMIPLKFVGSDLIIEFSTKMSIA